MNDHPSSAKADPPNSAGAEGSNRAFGVVFAGAFAIFGLLPLRNGEAVRDWPLALAGVCLVLALVSPAVLAWPNRGWAKFGELLHRVTSPIAVGAIYVVGVLPAGLLMRWTGKDPLHLKPDPTAASYWIARTPPATPDRGFRNQF